MVKCERCNKKISSLLVNIFNYDGSDSDKEIPIHEYEINAVTIDVDSNWCGYELTEEEQRERILCPHCKQFPFKNKEIQVHEIVRIVCFKEE